jgi:hypothetical protein
MRKRSKYSSCQSASCFLTSWGTCSLAWKVFQSFEVMTGRADGEVRGGQKDGMSFDASVRAANELGNKRDGLTKLLSLDETLLEGSSDSVSALLLVSV